MTRLTTEEVVQAMKEILGERFVSADPGILDSYAFQLGGDLLTKGKHKFGPRPLCVVLPATTQEVIDIVKFCNKNNYQYKAFSTGWGAWCLPGREERVIQIDLKRMDKILSIDPKNMIGVVEPYVNGAMMQAELFKLGLNCHIAGCGANGSLLASACAVIGMGWSGISMGFSNRNVLGLEWVMPDGNLMKIGSWGAFDEENKMDEDKEFDASEWFLGDGPGPSLRGIIRGYVGSLGGLGVFTKVALKLYHWSGPSELEVEGHFPNTNLKRKKLPPNVGVHAVNWNDWEDFKRAGYKLAYSETITALTRTAAFVSALGVTPNNAEFEKIFNSQLKDIKYNLLFVNMANNKKEFDYQEKLINRIINETNGEPITLFETPYFRAVLFLALMKQSNNVRGVFRAGGGFKSCLGAFSSWDWCVEGAKIGAEIKKKVIEQGVIVNDMGDNAWGDLYEHGNYAHLEELFMYDITDPKSREGARVFLKDVNKALREYPLGIGIDSLITPPNLFGPLACDYHVWLNAIKIAFDPNNASDPSNYIKPKVRLLPK